MSMSRTGEVFKIINVNKYNESTHKPFLIARGIDSVVNNFMCC